jgi:hypothetical protein
MPINVCKVCGRPWPSSDGRVCWYCDEDVASIKKEDQLYEPSALAIENLLLEAGYFDYYFQITAREKINKRLEMALLTIDPHITLDGNERPDILGFVRVKCTLAVIPVEVKVQPEIEDVYQVKRYADAYRAHFPLLLSLFPPSEDLQRKLRTNTSFITCANGSTVRMGIVGPKSSRIRKWVTLSQ